MAESPIEQLLKFLDRRDLEAVTGLLAPDVSFLSADGRRGEGKEAVRAVLQELLDALRSISHRITAQWNVESVWIAEVLASYELQDWLQLNELPRALILRQSPEGISDLRVYGAHEQPLPEHLALQGGLWTGVRWIPPL